MSLYAGIALGDSAEPTEPILIAEKTAPEQSPPEPAAAVDAAKEVKAPETKKPNWSASLSFAPVKRKPAAQPKKPSTALSSAFLLSSSNDDLNESQAKKIKLAPASSGRAPLTPADSILPAVNRPSSSTHAKETAAPAQPVTDRAAPSRTASAGPSTSRTPRVIPKPPPLTLPESTKEQEDINGFRSSEAGKRLEAQRNKKNKKRGKLAKELAPLDYGADYDPARPNDYNDWLKHVAQLKEEKIQAALDRLNEKKSAQYDNSSYSEDESDDDARSNSAPKPKGMLFAPPAAYDDDRAPSPAREVQPLANTAEEAYARRAAMSRQMQDPLPSAITPIAQTADEAYARRAAMSRPAPEPSAFVAPPEPIFTRPTPAQSGDEAYARRAAMSAQPTPSFVAAAAPAEPAPVATPDDASPEASQAKMIAEAQAKARAIAERFSKLKKPSPEASTATAQEPRDVAASLMSKWGWREGQGLGVDNAGMLKPLQAVSHHEEPSGNAKNRKGKPTEATEQPQHQNSMAGKGRGTIVSDHLSQQKREEREKFGEPTPVVLLTNLVGRDDVDDDLTGEIAEEARKGGIVERCLVHLMPQLTAQPLPDEDQVRVFVLFSGLVGAFNAVRSFDGRFFGGRTVKARFYNQAAFQAGVFDL
ncbi:uncharacterized protein L969DRAFT_95244 [Mixia osmundae IAM 14324]|uniref:G-patch domain-containing protein n=1 Tax=Mixia osmundae (strain CBS 9802 / IAM 14324 / JCM 22182 / KY 12970) TaxID=764103 RepID=G7E6Q9_MIXOS|nr:uncharacterized protein L969DRAFT_95244 [Mixia osmundae IAM 14324]KEI39099.1 hypothetical protein L969DRAFT_95244 [Mixia osmundae IAM 14324]GAA98519.1 hypothetical protein E5Q_05205 [Mixia osmundae IAM 14324]